MSPMNPLSVNGLDKIKLITCGVGSYANKLITETKPIISVVELINTAPKSIIGNSEVLQFS